ncbi:TIGR00730 family Rossman fold protein [Nocardiopsis sp. NPDC049922]|uniref:LOG family protein n=1 Tax=Nocardiopsis sp. NPDC049922 TaxID=3155157 RepID=UPI00340A3AC0
MTTRVRHTVGVFCGSRAGIRSGYTSVARTFGARLAERGAGLVYGAGGVGVMGAVAGAAAAGGAPVTGVIPHDLRERERMHEIEGRIFISRSMHERKALMYRLSTGFAALPGGLGTLDELMETATWNQLGIHDKPIVLMNCHGFFDPVLRLLEHVVAEGFLSPEESERILVAQGPEEALDLLLKDAAYQNSPPWRTEVSGAETGLTVDARTPSM